jgi:hypothetical protein
MFCVIASVAWLVFLQITEIKECIYSEHNVIAGVKKLHIHEIFYAKLQHVCSVAEDFEGL